MPDPSPPYLLEIAEAATRAAGAHALKHYARRAHALKTTDHDVKLELDVECQHVAAGVIKSAFPEHAFLGEEGGQEEAVAPEYRWIVDPIDGTVNFSHGLPIWCCSIAVEHRGRSLAGAVFLPMMNELYSARVDAAAHLNGNPIRVSSTKTMRESMVYTGVLKRSDDEGASARVFDRLARDFQKVRILGSAAAELCYVACGRGDAYIETTIHVWDVAAGRLLIERAGGRAQTLFQRSPLCMCFCGGNAAMFEDFERAAREALKG